jgi:hypothetical protein
LYVGTQVFPVSKTPGDALYISLFTLAFTDYAKPFRVRRGKDFRLKDVDPNNTREFTKEADKARAKQALANGVTAEVHGQP